MPRPISKSKARTKPPRKQEIEDDYLDTDSEVDEFATAQSRPGPSGSSDQSEGEDEPVGADDSEDGEEGVGQWEPDGWENGDVGGSSGDESGSASGGDDESGDEDKLQEDLRQIPLSTLMKASRSLKKSKQRTQSLPETNAEKLAAAKARLADMQRIKGKAKAVDLTENDGRGGKNRDGDDSDDSDDGPEGRSSKHAPAQMSTKRQVSRHRQAISLPKREVRDPRFSSISGTLDPHLHAKAYSFLPDMLKDEYHNLRRSVAAAQKIARTCPLREKEAREEEVRRLELDLGRLRTKMDRGRAEKREREVLSQVKKEERDKRSEGKGAWYMKKGEKKDLLLKARFEALEQAGGKRAVKKAVDKKRKKVAGKEKKSRPDGVGGADSKKRRIA